MPANAEGPRLDHSVRGRFAGEAAGALALGSYRMYLMMSFLEMPVSSDHSSARFRTSKSLNTFLFLDSEVWAAYYAQCLLVTDFQQGVSLLNRCQHFGDVLLCLRWFVVNEK